MRQIWAVARGHPQFEFTEQQLTAQLKAHPEVLSWDVYKSDHKELKTGISSGAHLIAKGRVTDMGQTWVKQNLQPQEQ